MPGFIPGIQSVTVRRVEGTAEWTPGTSPGVTKGGHGHMKKWNRVWKIRQIMRGNPERRDLSDDI